jgi:hypothetical protein
VGNEPQEQQKLLPARSPDFSEDLLYVAPENKKVVIMDPKNTGMKISKIFFSWTKRSGQ